MNLSKKIEAIANVATTVAALLLVVVLVRGYLIPAPGTQRPQMAPPASVGTNLKSSIPGVDWTGNGRTLVLAISNQCHFCKESEPFYRRLREELGARVKIVAAMPQPVADAEQYLKSAGVEVDQVRQVTLSEIGVRGTPTMLLVDGSGRVTGIWTGRLQPAEEDQVLSSLRSTTDKKG
jgi:hypothetical protein